VFLSVDCERFWRVFNKDTFELLKTRLPDFGVPARAALLVGLIKTKGVLHSWWVSWVRDVFLETRGEELTLLKNMVDSGGDYQNLYKHIYKDLRVLPQNIVARRAILEHIQTEGLRTRRERQANLHKRPRIKIVSDIDDTLWSSGGRYPAGIDSRFPKGVIYPGVLALFREIIHDSGSWQRAHRIDEILSRCKSLCRSCDVNEEPQPTKPRKFSILRSFGEHEGRPRNLGVSTGSTTMPASHPYPRAESFSRLLSRRSFDSQRESRLQKRLLQRCNSSSLWDFRRQWRYQALLGREDPELEAHEGVCDFDLDAKNSGEIADLLPLRRGDSDSALEATDLEAENQEADASIWCRVPGFFECYCASEDETLSEIRTQMAHHLTVPERSIGQIHVDYSEIDQHFNTDCSLMFLSARPGIPRTRGFLERQVYKRFRDLYRNNQLFTMPTLLPGSLSAGLKAIGMQIREAFSKRLPLSSVTSAWIPVGFQKMIAFRNFAALYPEYDFVFFGDNGQADMYLCDRLMWEPPVEDIADVETSQGHPTDAPPSRSSLGYSNVLVAFIHKVHNSSKLTLRSDFRSRARDSCWQCRRRTRVFETYVGAAVQAAEEGLLSLRGLRAVGSEAIEDFYRLLGRSVVRGAFATWRRKKAAGLREALNLDLEAANELLPQDSQLPLLVSVAEWERALNLDVAAA